MELHDAIKTGRVEDVKRTVTQENVNVVIDRKTSLGLACGLGQVEIVKILINCGVSLEHFDSSRWSPLHDATVAGQRETVELLIERGADVNACDADGTTPLHVAAVIGQFELVQMFLQAGGDVTKRARYGRNPLQLLAGGDGDPNIIDALLDQSLDVNAFDDYGQTALDIATGYHAATVCEVLLSWGGCISPAFHCEETAHEREEHDQLVSNAFKRHSIKMKIAGLLSDKTGRGQPLNDQDKDFEKQCAAEIARLQVDNIGSTSFTYFDLLKKKPAALLNGGVKDVLTKDNHRQRYPIYGRVIDGQRKLGLERLELLENCGDVLKSSGDLCQCLPPELIDLICTYLDNVSLQTVIQSSVLIAHPKSASLSNSSRVKRGLRTAIGRLAARLRSFKLRLQSKE